MQDSQGKEVILLLSQSEKTVTQLQYACMSAQLTLVHANRVAEAQECLSRDAPLAIIIDPGNQFVEFLHFCHEVRTKHQNHELPIFVIHENAHLHEMEQAYAVGASDYLIKPVNYSELLERLQCRRFPQATTTNPLLRIPEALQLNEEELYHYTHFDALTQLPNRIAFIEHLNIAVNAAEFRKNTIAVLVVDLDNFKRINETLDHHAGDELLRLVSQRLEDTLAHLSRLYLFQFDAMHFSLARLSGDEFAVLIVDHLKNQQVAKIAQQIIVSIREPYTLVNENISISASIGITLFPHDGHCATKLLKNADIALHHAKANCKNNYQFFNEAINISAQKKLSLENDLFQALENDEIFLVYQPIISLDTGQMHGVEALLRWQHPKHGLIPPDDFISIAEETNLIDEIGNHILRKACLQAMSWQTLGAPSLMLAVNLSSKQLQRSDFSIRLAEILQDTGYNPKLLEFELTESILLEDEKDLATLHQIKQLGVGLSIDDFGTGYSSLRYLSEFPFNKIKIDRTFLGSNNANNSLIVRGIILLGHTLKLEIIAEGVETIAQLSLLRQAGCDYAQGFLMSRPLPHHEITALIQNPPSTYLPLFSRVPTSA